MVQLWCERGGTRSENCARCEKPTRVPTFSHSSMTASDFILSKLEFGEIACTLYIHIPFIWDVALTPSCLMDNSICLVHTGLHCAVTSNPKSCRKMRQKSTPTNNDMHRKGRYWQQHAMKKSSRTGVIRSKRINPSQRGCR
jgi:hypothetical protein